MSMDEPGLDLHEWETRWAELEEALTEDPAEGSPGLPALQLQGALNALTLNRLTTEISLRFTPRGTLFGSGTWQVDDIYVDPWKVI